MPGAAEPHILETASQYVTADKPETTAAFPVSQEIVVESNPNLTPNPNPPPHTSMPVPHVGYRIEFDRYWSHVTSVPPFAVTQGHRS